MALPSKVGILKHGFTNRDDVWGVIHLPGGQRITTCSLNGSLRVWNLKSGEQIGDGWRDGESGIKSIPLSPDGKKVVSGSKRRADRKDRKSGVYSIALSPDGKKMVSRGKDGAVRLWDIDTCKAIAKWTGHTEIVWSVYWSRDGRRVLSGSTDGTARQWDVESGETRDEETMIASIKTGHKEVWAVVYSPDMTWIATGGRWDELSSNTSCSLKIWDARTGKLVTTLKGHMDSVRCLAWTKDGKTLISGSYDYSIRTWNTTNWEQAAVLVEHAHYVMALAISPNSRILASASGDKTARLWNLDNGQPINSPLQHLNQVNCVSFSADGKLLATGCRDNNAYSWDVAAIVREAGLDELLSDSKANKSVLHANAARRPIQQRPPAGRVPHGFFDGVPPAHISAPQETTLLGRLFHRSPSSTQDTSSSSPLDWARNIFKRRGQSGEEIEFQGHSPTVVEAPYAQGKRRNASGRDAALAKQRQQKMKPLPSKNSTAGNSQPPKPIVVKPPSQTQAVASSSTTPATGDASEATTSTPSRPDATIRQAGLWTRFWLFLGCLSPEYTDDHH